MACIAAAFFYLNRADPDCGTNFAWVTRSMGPRTGWLGGWSSMMADLIIMPSLAQIASQVHLPAVRLRRTGRTTTGRISVLGIAFIMAMTWICVVGIELSARTQMALLIIELAILVLFSVVALVKVYAGDIPGSVHPSLSWLTPTDFGGISNARGRAAGRRLHLLGLGHRDERQRGVRGLEPHPRASRACSPRSSCVGIFIVVSFAAQAVKGAGFLTNHSDDVLSSTGHIVFGSSGWGDVALKLLIIAVLSSAAASCQTTILPCRPNLVVDGAAPRVPAQVRRGRTRAT